MSWRDKLREASFRGVPFFYTEADLDFGRRNQRHEYPVKDDPFHEDLGRKVRVHHLEVYVWGVDADVQANRLADAIEQPGSGTLVHPHLGELTVAIIDARRRWSTKDGGYNVFSLTFEETGETPRPRLAVDSTARIDVASNDALSAVQQAFKSGFNVTGLPQFVATDAADQLTGSMDSIQGAFTDMRMGEQQMAGWVNLAADIKSRSLAIVRDPSLLAYEVASMIGVPLDLPGLRLSRSLSRLFSFGSSTPAIVATTSTRFAQQNNRTAFSSLVRQTAVIHAARAATRETFDSRPAALARRDQVANVLEAELMTAPDTSYRALSKLRAEVVKGMDISAAQLPRLKTITSAATRPALALAYEFYGDNAALAAAKSIDVVARNQVRHPGFVPGSQALEVSIDV